MSTAVPPPVLQGPARALFEPFTMALLATTNADTSPQVSLIAAQLDGDEIVLLHRAWYQKLRNIRRNPRVALTVIPPVGPEAGGPQPYLVVHGIARVQQGDAGPWQERLLDAMAAGAPPGTPSARPGPPPEGGWTTHRANLRGESELGQQIRLPYAGHMWLPRSAQISEQSPAGRAASSSASVVAGAPPVTAVREAVCDRLRPRSGCGARRCPRSG